jgi:hypothetical protein
VPFGSDDGSFSTFTLRLEGAAPDDIVNGAFDVADSTDPQFGWTILGSAPLVNGAAVLNEDDRFNTGMSQIFTVTEDANFLQFTIVAADLAPSGLGPPDAFEVALLDRTTLAPLVGTTEGLSGTDALLNIQQTGEVFFGSAVYVNGASVSGDRAELTLPLTIEVDLQSISIGTEAMLFFDLLGFGSLGSSVSIDDVVLSDTSLGRPPSADAGGPYSIGEGDSLPLDASGSSDPDDDPLTYTWDVNGDGVFGDAVGATPTLSWNELQALGIRDDGDLTVSVLVDDGVWRAVAASTTLTINNTSPSTTLAGAADVEEATFYSLTIGEATDPGDDSVTDYTVHWGDGSTDTYDQAGLVTHRYEEGPATRNIVVDLIDEDGTHSAVAELTVEVINVAPTSAFSNDGPVDEGSTATVIFAGQFDPSTADTDAGFTYSYDFDNDGAFEVIATDSPVAIVPASFLSDGPATQIVRARIADEDGGFTDYTSTIIVENVAAVIESTQGQQVDEGAQFDLTFDFIDPGTFDTHTATIDWGDGTPVVSGVVMEADGNGTVTGTHNYEENGVYNIDVSVADRDGGVGFDTIKAIVVGLGDLTRNGFVDFADLTLLLANWNQDVSVAMGNLVNPATSPVGFPDLTVLLANWTGSGPDGGAQALRATHTPPTTQNDSQRLAATEVFDRLGRIDQGHRRTPRTAIRRRARRESRGQHESPLRRLQAVAVDRALGDDLAFGRAVAIDRRRK